MSGQLTWKLRHTVEMIPGTRITGCLALRPLAAISSPTLNSKPFVLIFQTSGILLRSLFHSFSTNERSSWGSWGSTMPNSSSKSATWVWISGRSLGCMRIMPMNIPTIDHYSKNEMRSPFRKKYLGCQGGIRIVSWTRTNAWPIHIVQRRLTCFFVVTEGQKRKRNIPVI